MEENSRFEPTPKRFRPLQFQLAQVAVFITATAILLIFSAPWIRAFNAAQWMMILRGAICLIVGAIVFWTFFEQLRRNAILRAEGLLLVVEDQRAIRWKTWRSAFLVILFFCPVFLLLFQVHLQGKSNPPTSWMLEAMNLLPPVAMELQFILILRSSDAPQFRENGLLLCWMLYPWEDFKSYRWSGYQPNQLQLLGSIQIQVEPAKCEQVEAILRTHLTGFIQSPGTSHSED
ncbi:hypothetical protein [Blastopirellula marina]|uniref:DUF5673 domain-containing protein n=1 Tax=Blastopirellula marina DSM 3645 TaxID=314230 RepID=A3ZZE9_9BACT|nr:hypothetical protein [Blastopirellula marina]EAQ78112.1 hypothetical protein DSM3645_18866 [Blastopirellula marina DSM 3645]